MNLEAVFRFHLDRIIFLICRTTVLVVGHLKVPIVNPADINVKECIPCFMLSHQHIACVELIVHLTKVCVEKKVASDSTSRTGKASCNKLTVRRFLLLQNLNIIVFAPAKIDATSKKLNQKEKN